MPNQLNKAGESHARSLIASGKISHGGWDESKVERSAKNANCFLGTDPSAKPDTAGHWKYPICHNGMIYAQAVGSALSYAKKSGDGSIASAAQSLSDAIKAKEDKAGTAARQTATAIASLRGLAPTSHSDGTVTVDKPNGIIKNVSLMTVGEALGWPFDIDGTTLDQLIEFVNADTDGVKCRFAHPKITREMGPDGEMGEDIEDDIGRVVGRIKNARRDGDCARGDLHIGDYATNLPALGDVRSYLLAVAEADPRSLGMSAMFPYTTDPQIDDMGRLTGNPARLHGLDGIDLVGKPAANPAGLLSARQQRTVPQPTPPGVADTTTAPNIGGAFDPQPPSPREQIGPSESGWQENDPREVNRAPVPANTIEFPDGTTQPYLGEMLAKGYLHEGMYGQRKAEYRAAMATLCRAGLATFVGGAFLPTARAKSMRARPASAAPVARLKRTITYDAAGKVLSVVDSKL